jgi:hypothetical protein
MNKRKQDKRESGGGDVLVVSPTYTPRNGFPRVDLAGRSEAPVSGMMFHRDVLCRPRGIRFVRWWINSQFVVVVGRRDPVSSCKKQEDVEHEWEMVGEIEIRLSLDLSMTPTRRCFVTIRLRASTTTYN